MWLRYYLGFYSKIANAHIEESTTSMSDQTWLKWVWTDVSKRRRRALNWVSRRVDPWELLGPWKCSEHFLTWKNPISQSIHFLMQYWGCPRLCDSKFHGWGLVAGLGVLFFLPKYLWLQIFGADLECIHGWRRLGEPWLHKSGYKITEKKKKKDCYDDPCVLWSLVLLPFHFLTYIYIASHEEEDDPAWLCSSIACW